MTEKIFDYYIKGEKGKWEVIIGLEVHAQVSSKSKLFSSSPTKFGAEPNTQVSLVDSAFPGMLPVINQFCIEQSVKTGLGLKAKINLNSVFDRKNYFYADLPQGYQISQYKNPIVGEGEIILDMPYGTKKVGIERLHLEQDAGKSIHDMDPDNTFVDLNRSGVALMEIVSKPDLRSPDEVNAYIKKLRSIMRYLGTCDGNMQEGSLRADVNVSVRKVGEKKFGTRCEIKNVNSIKFMQMAIEYEAKRQVELLESGKTIDQETRLFDTKKNTTRSMRSKEDAHDYRYFPNYSGHPGSRGLVRRLFRKRLQLFSVCLDFYMPAQGLNEQRSLCDYAQLIFYMRQPPLQTGLGDGAYFLSKTNPQLFLVTKYQEQSQIEAPMWLLRVKKYHFDSL